MSNNAGNDGNAVAWDPKSPATLLVPTLTEGDGENDNADADAESGNAMVMNHVLCDTGVGCNPFESSAIMNLLDARDEYLELRNSNNTIGTSSTGTHTHEALLSLSQAYRKALSNCILEWSEDLGNRTATATANQSGSDDDHELQQQLQDQDLLKAAYAVTHLSEVFLLVPSRKDDSASFMMDTGGGFGYEETILGLPGAVTADTVRYLRLHHLGDAADLVDPAVLEELYEVLAPDLYGDETYGGTGGSLYWELLEAYFVRGCLEDAWALLSHHSIVRRFLDLEEQEGSLNEYQAASLAEDRDGFLALKNILLSAPLPGGRSNEFDEGFAADREDSAAAEGSDPTADEELIDGISTSAHRLWETGSGSGSNARTGDYPVGFEPHAANQVHQYWKQAIDGIPALQRLRRRLPQLNRLLALLRGNFRDVTFGSWQEELCAELLYKTPGIRLEDIHVRAKALMERHAGRETEEIVAIDEIFLTIMKGNAGEAVRALHGFGGGSGAALPAVMTSLLSQLLGDANVLQNPSESFDFNTEMLIGASSAIRSSLSTEGYYDLGTRLAVRLLLPHIEIDSDLRITATLVDTLEHHSPKTDSEANMLLSLCRNLVERKNVRVLDGCASICLARHLFYIDKATPGGAVHWLLAGMEFESLVLCDGPKRSGDWQRALASGVCYRKLVAYFTETSRSLLKMLLGEEKGASLFYARAKEMIAATKEESRNNANNLASFVPAVTVLENVLVIAGAIVERKDDSIVASSIVACLEERPNDEDDGVVSSLARCLGWDLFRLAMLVLEKDAKKVETQVDMDANNDRSISSFDVRGMGVLLSVFTIETKAREVRSQNETLSEQEAEDLQRTRVVLAQGLKRAFVAENAMKRASAGRRSRASAERIYPANFSKHSREKQELAVQRMLEY
eukprot:jgi/Psemu1/62505/estExt_Genemark1.C_30027